MNSNKMSVNPFLEEDLDPELFQNDDEIEIFSDEKRDFNDLEEFEEETSPFKNRANSPENAKIMNKVSKNEELIANLLKKVNYLEIELRKLSRGGKSYGY